MTMMTMMLMVGMTTMMMFPPVSLLACFALPRLLVGRPHRDDVPEHEHDDPDDVLDHHVDVDDVLDHYNHVDDE